MNIFFIPLMFGVVQFILFLHDWGWGVCILSSTMEQVK